MLLVVSMSSHDFFIITDIVNVSEKQKYISVVVAAAAASAVDDALYRVETCTDP